MKKYSAGPTTAASGSTGGGSPGTFTSLTATGLFTQAGEDGITAFATGGQTNATALSATKNLHRISVCATQADSVKLPAALVGQAHYVRNDGAAAAQVFGQATETINGIASATGVVLPVGAGAWYVCTTAGAWTSTVAINNSIHLWSAGNYQINSASAQIGLGVSFDAIIAWATTNSLRFGMTSGSTVTSRTEMNKAVTAIANAAATDVLTVTIPNAAHNATLMVTVDGALGAGGAIGAGSAMATNTYMIGIVRTAGVATVATATAARDAVAVAVAGSETVTCTAAVTAMTGLVSATQTFTVQVTITRSAGSSTNHTCQVYARLLNANATGITIA